MHICTSGIYNRKKCTYKKSTSICASTFAICIAKARNTNARALMGRLVKNIWNLKEEQREDEHQESFGIIVILLNCKMCVSNMFALIVCLINYFCSSYSDIY